MWELHSVLDVERIMATAITIPGQVQQGCQHCQLSHIVCIIMNCSVRKMMMRSCRIGFLHPWRIQAAHLLISPTRRQWVAGTTITIITCSKLAFARSWMSVATGLGNLTSFLLSISSVFIPQWAVGMSIKISEASLGNIFGSGLLVSPISQVTFLNQPLGDSWERMWLCLFSGRRFEETFENPQ